MLSITSEQMDILIQLQGIEDESIGIKKVLGEVQNETDVRKKKLQDAENDRANSEAVLAKVRTEYRDFEIEVEERNTRLKKSEEYLKNVTSNTEYQTLLREIDDNKKRNSELESQMIEFLDQIEKSEKEVGEKKETALAVSTQITREISEIEENSVSERSELQKIIDKKETIAAKLDTRLYKRFNNILGQSAGKGIVPVTNSICGGCYMNIPPQMNIELQRAEGLYFCPQCHRMIYYKEEA